MNESTDLVVNGAAAGLMFVYVAVYLAVSILMIVSVWKIFSKAGQPGWAAIVPIFNMYIMLQVAGKPGWWLLLMFIPVANLIVIILMYIGVAESFNKGAGFGLGLAFLPIIFMPILAFGDAQYSG